MASWPIRTRLRCAAMPTKERRRTVAAIRAATLADIDELLLVEEEAWKNPAQRAPRDALRARIETFPAGVLLAEADGAVWGYVVVQRMRADVFLDHERELSWDELTGHGLLATHCADGEVLYGVNLAVASSAPAGTQFLLMEAVGKLAIRLNVREILLGGRLPAYHKYQDQMSADEYVRLRVRNRPRDPELWMYARAGLEVVRVLPNYFPDPDSCNFGVLLRWRNPFYGRPALLRWAASRLFKV